MFVNSYHNRNEEVSKPQKHITGLDSQTAFNFVTKLKALIFKYAKEYQLILPSFALAFNLNLHKEGMYLRIYDRKPQPYLVDLNPDLAIEYKQDLTEDTAKRIVLKLSMLDNRQNPSETSHIYQSYCRQLHLYNYHGLPETPFKYFVVRCRLCREPFYIFRKKPSTKMMNRLLNVKLPFHQGQDFNANIQVHRGTLSQGSYEELTNSQAWFYLQRMSKLNDFLKDKSKEKEEEFNQKYFK